jgi:hypothetical protein
MLWPNKSRTGILVILKRRNLQISKWNPCQHLSLTSCLSLSYYQILDISRTSTQSEIREAYIEKTREVIQKIISVQN